ncbi:hypothetical protein C2E23DRAFT_862408 [Lenzites betulinus]|nr:hypothetical protein C2E23DRAFT_862408 [Lenzites betulinus]
MPSKHTKHLRFLDQSSPPDSLTSSPPAPPLSPAPHHPPAHSFPDPAHAPLRDTEGIQAQTLAPLLFAEQKEVSPDEAPVSRYSYVPVSDIYGADHPISPVFNPQSLLFDNLHINPAPFDGNDDIHGPRTPAHLYDPLLSGIDLPLSNISSVNTPTSTVASPAPPAAAYVDVYSDDDEPELPPGPPLASVLRHFPIKWEIRRAALPRNIPDLDESAFTDDTRSCILRFHPMLPLPGEFDFEAEVLRVVNDRRRRLRVRDILLAISDKLHERRGTAFISRTNHVYEAAVASRTARLYGNPEGVWERVDLWPAEPHQGLYLEGLRPVLRAEDGKLVYDVILALTWDGGDRTPDLTPPLAPHAL